MTLKTTYNGAPLLPIAPFRTWLEEQIRVLGVNEVSRRLGVDQRIVFRWRTENRVIRLDKVDEALCRFGRPDVLNDLYPVPDELLEAA